MNEIAEDNKINILLVDDDKNGLLALTRILEQPEYNLVCANSGQEALDWMLQEPACECAVILLDVRMAGIDGLETARLIRSRKRTRNIPIIFITGFGEKEYLQKGYEVGAIDYIVKPFEAQVIRAKVAVLADLYRKSRQIGQANQRLQTELATRWRAESALRESESKFRSLTEMMPVGVLIAKDNAILYANPATLSILGYNETDLADLPLDHLAHPSAREAFAELLQSWHSGNALYPRQELMAITKDERVRWLDFSIRRIDYQGEAAILGTAIDISERKQAEDILLNLAQGVSAVTGERFLQSLLEYLAKTLQMKTAFVAEWNEAAAPENIKTLYLYDNGSFGANIEYAIRGTPCEQVLRKKTAQIFPRDVHILFPEDTHLREQGTASYAGAPLRDSQGRVFGLLGLLDSLPLQNPLLAGSLLQVFAARASAEVERVEAVNALRDERASLARRVEERTLALQEANHKLLRALTTKDEFLSSMSHELRTPLNTILNMAEILQDPDPRLREQQGKALHLIEESGRHLLSLINDILDLAKIEAGKMQIESALVAVEDLCDACLRLIKQAAYKKQIRLSSRLDPQVGWIVGDERRLKQILVNLLSNAVKFTPTGGAVTLEVDGHPERQSVDFQVSDTGIGIDETSLSRLFQPFTQLHQGLNREYEGTGLGLSLVNSLVELHGGKIQVASQLNQGSRFSVSLPWQGGGSAEAAAPAASLADSAAAPPASIAVQAGKLVMLVEDNPNNLETLRSYLSAKGFRLILAHNGEEALELVAEIQPDLILMDVQMPKMDGLEATRRIRAMPECREIPIIGLTALAMAQDKERCLAAGMSDYLSKPVNLGQLVARMDSYLNRHEAVSHPA